MRIFISYSSKDREQITTLAEDLELFDYTVWFDQELNRQGGHQWWALILEQIRGCDIFIYALSPYVLESEPCRREYNYAKALGKPILPIIVADMDIRRLSLDLQQKQILSYTQPSHEHRKSLKESLRQPPPASPLPDPLPEEPPTPLDPIAEIMERIETISTNPDQQKLLATDIYAMKESEIYGKRVPELLNDLLQREDVLTVRNYKLIKDLLDLYNQEHLSPLSLPTEETHDYFRLTFTDNESDEDEKDAGFKFVF